MPREDRERYESVNDALDALLGHAREYADLGFAGVAESLGRHAPFPPQLNGTPMVIDTDIGGDPDGAVALAVAARDVPELALVVTSDEHGGQRARFARHLLDLLGRADVPVVAGRELDREDRWFCVDGLIPEAVPVQSGDPIAAVAAVMNATDGPVRWAGCGPMSNLASVTGAHPELIDRLYIDQLGGAVNHHDTARGLRTIDRDVPAARAALRAVRSPWLVTSDVGAGGELAITAGSPVYQWLAEPNAPDWAHLLRVHFDRWFDRYQPASMQYETLTVAMATGMPFIDVLMDRVAVDERGRMRLDPAGVKLFYTFEVDYQAFWWWLPRKLGVAAPADRDPPGGSG